MRIYVSVDMEGVAGVVHVDQTRRTGHDYERARRWMTAEANAAIGAAFESGAEEVVVNDSHGDMRNLLIDELDDRARLITGSLKPLSMVQGVDEGRFDAALFVGYHAGAGSRAGILDHTYYGKVVTACRVGGKDFDETALNAAVCGASGVPVALVTGDATCCESARAALGAVDTVVVKDAVSRYAARSLGPVEARRRIREGTIRALDRLHRGELRVFVPAAPLVLELDFVNSAGADAAELVPYTERVSGRTVRYEAAEPAMLIRVIQAFTVLAASTLV